MSDAVIRFNVDDWKSAEEAFSRLSEAAKGTGSSLREAGESGLWLLDVFKDLGNSFAARVAEGVLLRDAMREVLGGLKDVAEALPTLIDHTIEFGSQLYDMSLKTGASVEGLSALRYVAGQTGIDFESFSTALYKMEVSLGSSGAKADEMQKHLDVLHLNLQTLKDEKPDQAFIDIMTALQALPNRADQAAAGMAVFGKGFKDMAGLTQESMGQLLQQAKDLGIVMSTETAAAADAADDAFHRLQMQVEALGTHIAGAFVPAIAGIEQDLSKGLNEAVKTLNASLSALGGENGFLATVARAMGTGSEAAKAQIQLYEDLKSTLLSLTRNTLEPLITAIGFVMTEFNAAKVLFRDIAQIVDGDALAFEYLALGIAKTLQFLHAGDWSSDIQRINENINGLLVTMKQRGDALEKDKDAEREWGNWAVLANESVETALNAVAATHTDLAATIQKGTDQSRTAFGGVGDAVEHGKEKVDKFKEAMEEVASVGTSWASTIDTIDGRIVDAAEGYIRAGLTLGALKEMYALTETQVKALSEAVKEQDAWTKELGREELEQIKLVAEEDKKVAAERAHLLKEHNDLVLRTFSDERRMEQDHSDFVISRALTTEQAQRLSIDRWYQDAVTKARSLGIIDQKYYDDLAQEARDKMQKVTDSHDLTFQAVKKMQEDLTIGWQQHFADSLTKGDFSVSGFANAFEGIFQTLKKDVEDIFSSMLSSIISGFLQPLLDNVRSVASSVSSMLISALTGGGGGEGGAISWALGGGSTPTHSLLSGALGSIFTHGSATTYSAIGTAEDGSILFGAGGGGAGAGGGIGGAITGAAHGVGSALGTVATFLATNPIGWAIDAGIGALALWNHFSGPDANEVAGREVKATWEDDIWNSLTTAQRSEATGAGWANPKDAGALIFMRTMYTNLHRPDPEKSAEAYMQNVWGTIPKGYNAMHAAIQDVGSFDLGGFVPRTGRATVHEGELILNQAQQRNVAAGLSLDALHTEIRGLRADLKDFFRFQPMLLRHAMRGA